MHRLGSLAAALAATLNLSVAAAQFNPTRSGHNTVFIHADGVGLAQWTIARAYWKGPDGQLNWDRLPQMAVYRGHLRDSLVASSNGGATTHAFGVKAGAGSFGRDAAGRRLTALSGYAGSLWREAAVRGHPVGLLNDGHLAEPGTAAFAAELDSRRDWNGAALQLLAGRDGASVGRSDDPLPHVLLGGGERNFLPQDAPRCLPGIQIAQQGIVTFPLDCMVHGLDWSRPERAAGPERTDGRNLLREAAAAGFVVIRTRAEFDATLARLQADRRWQPRILGLFAAHHLFNDRSEEDLLAAGFRRPDVDFRRPDLEPSGREARLVLFGSPAAGDPGFDPPRADEMLRLAMIVLGRVAQQGGRPYFLVGGGGRCHPSRRPAQRQRGSARRRQSARRPVGARQRAVHRGTRCPRPGPALCDRMERPGRCRRQRARARHDRRPPRARPVPVRLAVRPAARLDAAAARALRVREFFSAPLPLACDWLGAGHERSQAPGRSGRRSVRGLAEGR